MIEAGETTEEWESAGPKAVSMGGSVEDASPIRKRSKKRRTTHQINVRLDEATHKAILDMAGAGGAPALLRDLVGVVVDRKATPVGEKATHAGAPASASRCLREIGRRHAEATFAADFAKAVRSLEVATKLAERVETAVANGSDVPNAFVVRLQEAIGTAKKALERSSEDVTNPGGSTGRTNDDDLAELIPPRGSNGMAAGPVADDRRECAR